MKRTFFGLVVLLVLAAGVRGEFSFFLIDNFENGRADKWYRFGEAKMTVEKNPTTEAASKDPIAESCGEYALKLKSRAMNWFAGGIGTDLNVDASGFNRLQLDIYGSDQRGKIKIELFDDDNNNLALEQDAARDWLATKDDKWVAEVPILGPGFTRISIPFSAFKLENSGSGDGVWNPGQQNGSGGLLKVQLILLTDKPAGEVETSIDNLILTY